MVKNSRIINRVINTNSTKAPDVVLRSFKTSFRDQLRKTAGEANVSISFKMNYHSVDFKTSKKLNAEVYANTDTFVFRNRQTDFNQMFERMIQKLEASVIDNTPPSTKFTYESTESMNVQISRFERIRGGSYIILPKWISSKKACINIKNNDKKCFAWCILAHLNPVEIHPERTSNYKKKFDDLKFRNDINSVKRKI